MTTATLERDVRLPWEHFLEGSVRQVHPTLDASRTEAALRQARLHIDAWRRGEWQGIVRELNKVHYFEVPEELEPHWVSPGRAVYWQLQTVREIQTVTDSDGNTVLDRRGKPCREVIWKQVGYKPTTLQGLPANNASMIARYLEKGFRFRPPVEGTALETLQEAAIPAEALQHETPPDPPRSYICLRHPKPKEFQNWKGYIRHCLQYREPPTEELPAHIRERIAQYDWYCMLHNVGFRNERLAKRHLTMELRKPGRAVHPSVDDMKVVSQESLEEKIT
jgi:hypothetical protein